MIMDFYTRQKTGLTYYFLLFCLSGTSLMADTRVSHDKETNLTTWEFSEEGFEFTLKQAFPDQIRAFYLARGFSRKIANAIATSCVFQSIAKNTLKKRQNTSDEINDNTITVALKNWKVKTANGVQGIKLKQTWNKEWKDDEVTHAARIAFRWATLPTEQSYQPKGDYNWGMVSFGLLPGTKFDLQLVWKKGKTQHHAWVRSISCASDE